MGKNLQILGIGNAIVDILARVEDHFISDHNLIKGSMTLVEADRAAALYESMPAGREQSGGSVANSVAGIAMLGGRAGYVGKISNDQLGAVFRHDMTANGVAFDSLPLLDAEPTANCLVAITPDAERTMNTYLGACSALSMVDINKDQIADSEIIYIEGYLWDREHAKQACRFAMEMAHASDTKVAFTLSDPFCVDRYREDFQQLVNGPVDILFANRDELCSLYQTDDFADALKMIEGRVTVAAITCSGDGAIILAGGERILVEAVPTAVIDTTGAGDFFAAGFLYGVANGFDLEKAGQLGAACASLVISQIGPRPDPAALKAVLASLE